MKEDFKKAGKNSQDCRSKCAGEAKSGAHQKKSAHEYSKERSEHQKPEHKKW